MLVPPLWVRLAGSAVVHGAAVEFLELEFERRFEVAVVEEPSWSKVKCEGSLNATGRNLQSASSEVHRVQQHILLTRLKFTRLSAGRFTR